MGGITFTRIIVVSLQQATPGLRAVERAGGSFPIPAGENSVDVRALVDRSIVEFFDCSQPITRLQGSL